MLVTPIINTNLALMMLGLASRYLPALFIEVIADLMLPCVSGAEFAVSVSAPDKHNTGLVKLSTDRIPTFGSSVILTRN